MKKLIVLILFLAMVSVAHADTVATNGTRTYLSNIKTNDFEIYQPITLTADGTGGAVTDFAIRVDGLYGLQLVEVEVVHGTSTAAITIKNSRSTTVWYLSAIDATANKIYGGHSYSGIFPKLGEAWTLTTGAIDASDIVTIILKFSSKP